MTRYFLPVMLLFAFAAFGPWSQCHAQNPFDDAAVEAEPAEAEETAAAAQADKQAPAGPSSDGTVAEEEEPAVIAILESKPTSPDQLVRAIDTLVRLKRAELAKPM